MFSNGLNAGNCDNYNTRAMDAPLSGSQYVLSRARQMRFVLVFHSNEFKHMPVFMKLSHGGSSHLVYLTELKLIA